MHEDRCGSGRRLVCRCRRRNGAAAAGTAETRAGAQASGHGERARKTCAGRRSSADAPWAIRGLGRLHGLAERQEDLFCSGQAEDPIAAGELAHARADALNKSGKLARR